MERVGGVGGGLGARSGVVWGVVGGGDALLGFRRAATSRKKYPCRGGIERCT